MDREKREMLKKEQQEPHEYSASANVVLELITDLEQAEGTISALEVVIASARKGEEVAQEKLKIAREALLTIGTQLSGVDEWEEKTAVLIQDTINKIKEIE